MCSLQLSLLLVIHFHTAGGPLTVEKAGRTVQITRLAILARRRTGMGPSLATSQQRGNSARRDAVLMLSHQDRRRGCTRG